MVQVLLELLVMHRELRAVDVVAKAHRLVSLVFKGGLAEAKYPGRSARAEAHRSGSGRRSLGQGVTRLGR
jgi:hypothetical protein